MAQNLIHDSAKLFAQSEVQGAKAVEMLASFLGDSPAYDVWENARISWAKDYAAERKCNEEAAGKAWQRIAKRMEETYALGKPKAPSKAATKKAAARKDAAQSKAEVLKAVCGTDAPDLATVTPALVKVNNEIGKALAAGDNAKVAQLRPKAEALDAAHKAATKAEAKAAETATKAAEKADRDALIKWAKDASIADVRKVLASIAKKAKAA